MNLIHLLEQNCAALGEKPVFIEKGVPTGYASFYRTVSSVARGLRENGVGPGDNVLVLMPLSVALYAALCGVWAVGACVVIFDPSAGGKHITACLESIPVAAYVGNRQSLLLRVSNRAVRRIPNVLPVDKLLAGEPEGELAIAPVSGESPALITFTSGSTGIPKAIVRSHGFLLEQHAAITAALPYGREDVDLSVLSVFTLVNMMEGITTVLPRDSLRSIAKVDAGRLAEQIRSQNVTRITASPKLLEKLSAWALEHNTRLDSLTSVNIGGGPVFLDVLEQVAKVVNPQGIRVVYGSTEAEPIAELRYPELTREDRRRMRNGAGLLVGVSTDAVSLRIIRGQEGPIRPENLDELAREPGQWGEIIVSGRHVVRGYLNPAQNAVTKIYADDATWHRTGDCGYLDEQGRLWLLGRISQVITTRRGAVFPFAVEGAVRAKYRTVSALCRREGQLVLAVEQGRHTRRIQEEYGDRYLVLPLRKIPLDRRHSSKVDYGALSKLVEKARL